MIPYEAPVVNTLNLRKQNWNQFSSNAGLQTIKTFQKRSRHIHS